MPTPRRYAALDRLTPEQVRAFKRDALQPKVAPRAVKSPPLIAYGDSWFDYPLGTDIIDCLRKHHRLSIRNHAQAGDTLENMVYGARFNPVDRYRPLPSRLADVLDELMRVKARALLFSGGGNDIAGEEFAQFLEHTGAGIGDFRQDHARHVIGVFFRRVLTGLIVRAEAASPGVQIFTHGYGYPHADGRGVGIAIGLSFIGPWLRPALAAKRIDPTGRGAAIIADLIDDYNQMLMALDNEHENFHFIDLRSLIGRSRTAWVNELHVRNSVAAAIGDAFAARLRRAGVIGSPTRARPAQARPLAARRKRAAKTR